MFSLFLLFIIYVLLVGFLTILERKIIGLLQNRNSLNKYSFLSLYHFYLDFLKVFFKGFFGKSTSKTPSYLISLILMIFINLLGFYTLIFGFLFNTFFYKLLILYLILEGVIIVFKILILNQLESDFIKHTLFRIKYLYVILEGLFSYVIFINLIYLSYLNNFEGGGIRVFVFIIFIVSYIAVISKLFRIPFDYFEIESELTGGGVLEFQGLAFLLWSLFEYSSIFNNHIFLIFLLKLFFTFEFTLQTYLISIILLLSLTFVLRGVFLRIKYSTVLLILIILYYIITITMVVYI